MSDEFRNLQELLDAVDALLKSTRLVDVPGADIIIGIVSFPEIDDLRKARREIARNGLYIQEEQ